MFGCIFLPLQLRSTELLLLLLLLISLGHKAKYALQYNMSTAPFNSVMKVIYYTRAIQNALAFVLYLFSFCSSYLITSDIGESAALAKGSGRAKGGRSNRQRAQGVEQEGQWEEEEVRAKMREPQCS